MTEPDEDLWSVMGSDEPDQLSGEPQLDVPAYPSLGPDDTDPDDADPREQPS